MTLKAAFCSPFFFFRMISFFGARRSLPPKHLWPPLLTDKYALAAAGKSTCSLLAPTRMRLTAARTSACVQEEGGAPGGRAAAGGDDDAPLGGSSGLSGNARVADSFCRHSTNCFCPFFSSDLWSWTPFPPPFSPRSTRKREERTSEEAKVERETSARENHLLEKGKEVTSPWLGNMNLLKEKCVLK